MGWGLVSISYAVVGGLVGLGLAQGFDLQLEYSDKLFESCVFLLVYGPYYLKAVSDSFVDHFNFSHVIFH